MRAGMEGGANPDGGKGQRGCGQKTTGGG
jgi:hypothetical protein